MTTKVSILEKKIEVLEEQAQSIRKERYDLQQAFQTNLTKHFEKYFRGVVSEDITIACTSSGVYFYKKNQEGTYDKEIFSVYLKETYSMEGKKYSDAQLSYYTTYADSDWELHRLENLGRVAQLMRNFKDQVVAAANTISGEYIAELEKSQSYKRESEVDKQIREFRDEIHTLKREGKKKTLFSEEGLTFENPTYIQMKYGFEPRITKLKLIDVSKSGKKATAVFELALGDHISREENVNVERIVNQVVQF
jgi:DNA-binding protein H-NS